jgi:hypothetical protein
LWAGEALSIGLFTGAIGVAIATSGGYEHLRAFVGSLFSGKAEELIGDKADTADKEA